MIATMTAKARTCAAMFAATLLGSGNALAVDLAQTPLFLTGSVEPNVLYMVDDSGSMMFETLPESTVSAIFKQDSDNGDEDVVSHLFPPPANLYGNDPYGERPIPRFNENDRWANYYRSPSNNLVYYNPEVNYKPWMKADGSRMGEYDADSAPNHPAYPTAAERGTRDLTSDTTEEANWLKATAIPTGNDITDDDTDHTFYPATYFRFDGDDTDNRFDPGNYTRIEIKSGRTYDRGPGRTDCADHNNCTYSEEIQNFSNWYTYHRSRTLAARAAVGRAFSERGPGIRVGYASINDGDIDRGVRKFEGDEREDFFDKLYEDDVQSAGTPLRGALDTAGDYYEDGGDRGPWSTTPGESGGEEYACRSSYTVLMTDGYWNNNSPGVGDQDGSSGNTITNHDPDGDDFRYEPRSPFSDDPVNGNDRTNTLADVAMKYWKNDLRSDLDNLVPTTNRNEAYWQHMVTYGVSLGVEGTVNQTDAFDAIHDDSIQVRWPDPKDGEDSDKIDDLMHAAVNSRGDFFSAMDPERFASEMSQILAQLVGRSSGSGASVAANSTRLETDTLVFQGRFDSRDWSGDLWAFNLDDDGNLTNTSWEAAEQLNDKNPDNRNILSSSGLPADGATSTGIEFEWTELTNDQKATLRNGGSTTDGRNRLQYLRGDQSNERQNEGSFRNRDSIMGDIINSRPVYTRDERYGYRSWTTEIGRKYIDFIRDLQGYESGDDPNPGMVYVGGNDGMLHGFSADSGEEVFSYVPSSLYDNLPDLTDSDYSHRYFVDGSATVGDVYFDSDDSWHRVLIGTLGGGGSTVFALDITNPESMTADDVLWEFNHPGLGKGVKDVSLVRVLVDDPNNDDPEHRWDVVFGDGYGTGSAENDAQLYVLNAETGNLRSEAPIEVASGNANGLATPFVIDEDQDGNADGAYAGDLRGNVWKFSVDSAQWQEESRLFTAMDDDDNRQPITSKVDVGFNNDREKVVTFGTGKYLETDDNDPDGATPQDLYGLIDTDSGTLSRSNLLEQTLESELTEEGREYRIVSDNTLDPGDHVGWRVSLDPDDGPAGGGAKEGERSVVQPLIRGGVVTFVTIVPSDAPCDAGGTSWLTSVNINDGSRLAGSFFDVNDDGEINDDDLVEDPVNDGDVAPTSLKTESGIVDTPTLLAGEDKDTLIVSGNEDEEAVQTASDSTKGPQSWRQVR